eukprot:TRINITY_DN122418_c0_g1_i1.p1 TRINITY_DN122418_c0_g1~~TRINITY_DN122418_c0_g1_i1.p1  ORF type:complete len:1012 (-),score=179.97 TRINITY_DN122418_c0_g1_i1:233-3268(-)
MGPLPQRIAGRQRRFSEQERLSFGRWSFLDANHKIFGTSSDSLSSARASTPLLSSAKSSPLISRRNSSLRRSLTCLPSPPLGKLSPGTAAAQDLGVEETGKPDADDAATEADSVVAFVDLGYDTEQVQGIAERLFPMKEELTSAHSQSSHRTSQEPRSCQKDVVLARPPKPLSGSSPRRALTFRQPFLPTPLKSSTPASEAPSKHSPSPLSGSCLAESDGDYASLESPTPSELLGCVDTGTPFLSGACSTLSSPRAVGRDCAVNSGLPGRFQKEILERFRQALLQSYPSLHDAFGNLNHDVSRDRAMDATEFRLTLSRLGVGEEESDDIFSAMDSNSDGGVTLAEFLHALVDVSPEALLWELRCRLIRMNIGPQNLSKALELVQWPQHGWQSRATKVKRRTTRKMRGQKGKAEPLPGPSPEKVRPHGDRMTAAGRSNVPILDQRSTSHVPSADALGKLPAAGIRASTSNTSMSSTRPPSATSGLSSNTGSSSQPLSRQISSGMSSDKASSRQPSKLPDAALAAAAAAAHAAACASPVPAKRGSFQLCFGDWLKLCTSIYLTLFEAERLFAYLANDKGFVDLRRMFEALRTTVEPDTSLECFAAKAVCRYSTLKEAFNAHCNDLDSDPEKMLRWRGFHSLAVVLGVNDNSAQKLWQMLTRALGGEVPEAEMPIRSAGDCDGEGCNSPRSPKSRDAGVGVTETMFMHELSLWAPDTALELLRTQLCERFGSLAEGKRALDKQLTKRDVLSPRDFDASLRALGINGCDVVKVLSIVAGKSQGPVSLEATVETMRAGRRGTGKTAEQSARPGSGARGKVRNETLPIWEKLKAVQQDLRRRHSASSTGRPPIPFAKPFADSSPQFSRQCSAMQRVDKAKFSEAINGAVRSAETSYSKTMLQQCHRQVLDLEERWATQHEDSGASGAAGFSRSGSAPQLALTTGASATPPRSLRCQSPGTALATLPTRVLSRPSSRAGSRPPTSRNSTVPSLPTKICTASLSFAVLDACSRHSRAGA